MKPLVKKASKWNSSLCFINVCCLRKLKWPCNWWLIYDGVQCCSLKAPLTLDIDPQLTLWVLLAEWFLWGWFFKGPINIQWQHELWGQTGEWWVQRCHPAGKANGETVPAPASHIWLHTCGVKKAALLHDGRWQEYDSQNLTSQTPRHSIGIITTAISLDFHGAVKDEIEFRWRGRRRVGGRGGGWRETSVCGVEGVKVSPDGGLDGNVKPA